VIAAAPPREAGLRDPIRIRPRRLPTVSVVIPTKNEAANLPLVLPRLPDFVTEVIIVDAHSTDGTVEVARSLRPDARILQQKSRGKGEALRIGFEAATGDIIVSIDADGSTRPEEIHSFVEALMGGADYVKGSRYMPGGGSTDLTALRRLGNHGLTFAVRVVHRAKFSDLCYGFNAFWADVLPILELKSDGFEIETEMNLRAHVTGLRIHEVPSVEAARIYGASNLHAVRDGLRVLRQILIERRRGRSASIAASAPWAAVPMGHVESVAIPIQVNQSEIDDRPRADVAG
jgi:glycosyltransferase involved in cell wall biosynthesis